MSGCLSLQCSSKVQPSDLVCVNTRIDRFSFALFIVFCLIHQHQFYHYILSCFILFIVSNKQIFLNFLRIVFLENLTPNPPYSALFFLLSFFHSSWHLLPYYRIYVSFMLFTIHFSQFKCKPHKSRHFLTLQYLHLQYFLNNLVCLIGIR